MNLFLLDVDGSVIGNNEIDLLTLEESIEEVLNINLYNPPPFSTHLTTMSYVEKIIETNGLKSQKVKYIRDIKTVFTEKLRCRLNSSSESFKPTSGAIRFIQEMKVNQNVVLAFVSGSWQESTLLKLKAVGIDTSNIIFASCSDATTRSEIMALAAFRAKQDTGFTFKRRLYFGANEYDKMATSTLGYEFVAVGNHIYHHTRIQNFTNSAAILGQVGLTNVLKSQK